MACSAPSDQGMGIPKDKLFWLIILAYSDQGRYSVRHPHAFWEMLVEVHGT